MSYEVVEHTADIRLKVTAKSYSDLFKESLIAVMSLLRRPDEIYNLNIKR